MHKSFIGKHTLHKILSIIKTDLTTNHNHDHRYYTEEEVNQLLKPIIHPVQLVIDKEHVTDLMCYSIGNIVHIKCALNYLSEYMVMNPYGICIVPEVIRPKETTPWSFAGYAYREGGVHIDNQFGICARANADGVITVANDFGWKMRGFRISFWYTF